MEVVVPCYNYGAFLPACVHSILSQPGLDVRVTVVDDASPDGSGAVADGLAEADHRVKVLHNQPNLGMVGTFNRGIAQVDSDYMLLISADDLVAPGALTRAAALMERHPSVGLVYGHAQKFVDQPVPRRAYPFPSWTTWRGGDWAEMQLRRSWSNISSPEAVVRTRVQHEAGLYDADLKHTLDVEMWLRIAAISDVGHINGVDQAYYRRQPTSYSSAFGIYQDIAERWRAYEQFLAGWSDRARADRLRPVVQRNLTREALTGALLRLEHGEEDPEVVAQARAVAVGIDPGVVGTPLWRDIDDRLAGRPAASASAAVRRARRAVAHRARWSRWRRARYLG
ncbi:glycosyltransferase family A protein [Microbacterium sp. RD1]|uniref:glycosyltransferase family A protein n=1 Tax=Microbacterium sp. RD1 TaxID=3457313 RepID=UPI003FA5E3A0